MNRPNENPLETPIQYVRGVGPKLAERFKVLGITTVEGLLWHVPHTYQDRRKITPINQVKPGELVTVQGLVVGVDSRYPRRGRVREIVTVRIDDGEAAARAVWFNQSYIKKQMSRGVGLQLYGRTELYDAQLQFSSPEFTILDPSDFERTGEILPIYHSTKGLPQRTIRRTMAFALARMIETVQDVVPERLRDKLGLPSIKNAWRILHQPAPDDGAPAEALPEALEDAEVTLFDTVDETTYLRRLEEERTRKKGTLYDLAQQRLAYEEFLVMQWVLAEARHAIRNLEGTAHPLPASNPLEASFTPDSIASETDDTDPKQWPARYIASLPFQLTSDQLRVGREIQNDLASDRPMNRLLQGDVGSGKTVVAFYAMLAVAAGGRQAVLMVPTEILAEQHHATLLKLTRNLRGLNCGLLCGSAGAAERRELQRALQNGTIQLLVGTHALFEEPVVFENLGLAVVDEQHRFGVEQRRRLLSKGGHPDLLLMTATPIPRTLALSWYGDMDTSSIHQLPSGRPKVITKWTFGDKEEKVWGFVDEKIAEGQQAFVVCPLIEESEAMPDLPSAERVFARIQEGPLGQRRVALLHGQMRTEEKSAVMESFARGEIDLLVSTTVIEVGIDVPNATMMVILGADRFGLAQLHQLRGRIGRGTETSYCVLITTGTVSPLAERRLDALRTTLDGFQLAEEDLRLRGPGEIVGQRQSGLWTFHVADQRRDLWLLERAREDADEILERDPELTLPEHAALARKARAAAHVALRG